MATQSCPTCGGEVIQKDRWMLIIDGFALIVTAVLETYLPWLAILTVPQAIAGVYLIVWATIGRGLWCRQCKKFPSKPNTAAGNH